MLDTLAGALVGGAIVFIFSFALHSTIYKSSTVTIKQTSKSGNIMMDNTIIANEVKRGE